MDDVEMIRKQHLEIEHLLLDKKELQKQLEASQKELEDLKQTRLAPCGHSDQFSHTEDGGKNFRCYVCQLESSQKGLRLTLEEIKDIIRRHIGIKGDEPWFDQLAYDLSFKDDQKGLTAETILEVMLSKIADDEDRMAFKYGHKMEFHVNFFEKMSLAIHAAINGRGGK